MEKLLSSVEQSLRLTSLMGSLKIVLIKDSDNSILFQIKLTSVVPSKMEQKMVLEQATPMERALKESGLMIFTWENTQLIL